MTWEFARHMRPHKILAVDMGDRARGVQDWGRYDLQRLTVAGLHDVACALPSWLTDLDVIYAVETPYSYEAFSLARSRGIKSFMHVMPELYKWATHPDLPKPDVFLAPTTWSTEHFRPEVVLPIPVATERIPFRRRTQGRRFLHLAAEAMLDRAGTTLLAEAMHHVRSGVKVSVLRPGDRQNYWDAYEAWDVLVAPRRYGGLSLSLQEAMASGMAVIALDRPPEWEMLPRSTLCPVQPVERVQMQGGIVPVVGADPAALADTIDMVAAQDIGQWSDRSGTWARAHSWDAMLPRYLATFEGAVT